MPLRWAPWNEVAVALDATLKIRTRLKSSDVHLAANLPAGPVIARGHSEPYGGGSFTRITATAAGTPELRVVLARPGGLRPWRTARMRFDSPQVAFPRTVYSNDLGLARTWLDDEVRALVLECPSYRIELRSGQLTASINELEQSAADLEGAMRTISRIAKRGASLRRAWMKIAAEARILDSDTQHDRLSQLPSFEKSHGAATITITAFHGAVASRLHGRRLFTRLRAERRAHTFDEYVIHPTYAERALRPRLRGSALQLDLPELGRWKMECSDEARMRARVVAPIPELLKRSGVAVVVATRRHVTVYVPGLAIQPVQFRAAVALTAKLAVEIETEAVGPYR